MPVKQASGAEIKPTTPPAGRGGVSLGQRLQAIAASVGSGSLEPGGNRLAAGLVGLPAGKNGGAVRRARLFGRYAASRGFTGRWQGRNRERSSD